MTVRTRTSRVRRGTVLLLVLLVLVILTPILASAAHRAVAADAEGRELARDLQARWAQISIADAMILADPLGQSEEGKVQRQLEFSVRLGDHECQVLVSDEQAKANLNTLLAQLSTDRLQTKLRTITISGQSIRLRPLSGRDVDAPFVSYAQVFSASGPELLFPTGDENGLASHITLWGDGRLNLANASPEAARLVLDDPLGIEATKSLLDSIAESPDASLEQLLIEAGADAETIEEVSALVTFESNATGILIRTQQAGHMPHHRWTVHWTVVPDETEIQDDARESEPVDPGPHRRVILW